MKMPRPARQYVCIVDGYRRPSRQRNTKGRYRVAARDKRTAKRILQKAIGFGSIQIIYEDESPKQGHVLPLGQCRLERLDGTLAPVIRYDGCQARSQ